MFITLASTKILFFYCRCSCAFIKFSLTYNRKISLYCYVTADILTTVLQKCFLSMSSTKQIILSKRLGCHGNRKAKFEKKYSKITSSEAIRGIKLKLWRMFVTLASTKMVFFYCCCSCTLVAMAILSFHWLIIGKVKIGVYCYLIADILTEHF